MSSKLNKSLVLSKNLLQANEGFLQLPEKVLQFGTGVLLRGLIDYFIDNANRKGEFNGRVVIVKSTGGSEEEVFQQQDNLFTHLVKGYSKGETVDYQFINASISRVLNAQKHWLEILETARNPEISIVVSNTTEVGLSYVEEKIIGKTPLSFPGKLCAWLFERFNNLPEVKTVIIPTELLPDNGALLKALVLKQAEDNSLGAEFVKWLGTHCHFCSSLVDRIVPGKPNDTAKHLVEAASGYTDDLMIASEVYGLWAIEGSEEVADILGFEKANEGVVVASDITNYRERKLRLLNGTHTLSVGLAYLCGADTVKQAMDTPLIENFVKDMVFSELIPSTPVSKHEAETFASEVLDRFRNPFIEHKWQSISLQYTSKLATRVVPLIKNHYSMNHERPLLMCTGLAFWLAFLRTEMVLEDRRLGVRAKELYEIKDDRAALVARYRTEMSDKSLNAYQMFVEAVLADEEILGENLLSLPGLADEITAILFSIETLGAVETLKSIQNQ